MQTAIFKSPVTFAQRDQQPEMGVVNGMETALCFGDMTIETGHSDVLSICDVSALSRFGVKGPNAAAKLADLNVALPAQANSWAVQASGDLVFRLGQTEFLVENTLSSQLNQKLDAAIKNGSGVHKILRNDASFIISGDQAPALFSQVCAVDLMGDALDEQRLVMTVIAGVSATVLKQEMNNRSVYRIWCDGTFGPYLWKTLLGIIEELGGGAVGFHFHYQN